ncbi:permease prefix domain 1-containing protein [Clostridiaceae bacterium M8S5]|nr:permease prefix domain 1-containing protein [Clostridiaceae bacterium M8S5]
MITKNSENSLMRYVDEISARMELEGMERKDFEEEMLGNLKSSVNELISEGYDEKEAVKIAIERFTDDSSFDNYSKNDKHKVNPKELPAKLFSQVMAMIISITAVSMFVPHPINYLAILGIVAGLGYSIINTLANSK